MPNIGRVSKKRRFFSLTAVVMLVMSSMLIGINVQVPNATAIKTHNVGNVDIEMLTAFGRILGPLDWNGQPQVVGDPTKGGMGFIGLVIDHDGYDHTPGSENITDSFGSWWYASEDDFHQVNGQAWLINNATTQKSFGSFQNDAPLTGDPNDIFINQTAWTVVNKDWAIIQWALYNLKPVDITNLSIGLEVPLSFTGKKGVGGDGGDDIDGFDAANDTYWAQDDGGTSIGFASAIPTEPITHYYSENYSSYSFDEFKYFYENDTWLYERINASNQVVGTTPGNRISTVGWDGITLDVGSVKTFTLVIAVNDSFENMTAAVQDAQYYYDYVASGFRITEFCDADSVSQKVEVYNSGKGPTDLFTAGYRLSVTDGATFLTGDNWDKKPLPTYEYGVFTLSAGSIPQEGGTIGLYYDDGGSYILIDEVSYGQEGPAPDPLGYESVARLFDTSIVEYSNDWLRNASSGPTWGYENNVGIIKSPNVLINRVEFNPWNPAEAYVELMWTGGATNISGFKIVCDDVYVVPGGTILGAANRYFVLTQSNFPANFNMDSSADNVYLYDANDNLLDMVGWSTAHDLGTFMSRMPDGNGTYQGFNDTTSLAAGWFFNQQPTLQISEFYADTTTAKIEIYNPRGGDIVPDVSRWRLDVNLGTLTGGWAPDPIPGNRGYSIFTWDLGGGGTPGDEGDIISLFYDPGSGFILMDQVGYGTGGVAPDPFDPLESTGRYWDGAAYAYTNDWNRNASAGPTWNAQNDVPPIVSSAIVLNEVMFDPSADPDGHFFVIFNTGLTAIDMTGWQIVCDDIYTFTGAAAGLNLYIFRYNDVPAAQNMFDSMDFDGDNVYLYDSLGQRIDMVGWNTAHLTGMSVKRVPGGNGTADGYDDSTSEAAGWVFNNPLEVYLTEISDSGGTSQVEIYNFWYPTINFTLGGYSFDNRTGGITGTWTTSNASADEYAVFDVTTPNGLHDEGDTVTFYQNGILIDEVGYGLYGTVPDPLAGESVQRIYNPTSYPQYQNVWERNYTTGPNFGSQNDVPPANLTSSIILNEVLFYPNAPADAFVEIYNIGGASINISGYRIVCDTEFIVPNGTEIDFNKRFYYLLQGMNATFFDPANLDTTRDNIYLYDDNGSLIDMFGWNSQHTQGSSACRIPDGNGTRDGYDDVSSVAAGWQFDRVPTVHLISIETFDGRKPLRFGHFNSSVIFNLTITNLQDISDIIDILNVSQEGWIVEIYDETGTIKITNVTLNPDESINIVVNVTLPSTFPFIPVDNITITIRSTNSQIIGDSIILTAKVYPFLNLTKFASPYEINMNGTGYDEITKITLNLTGMGAQFAKRRYLDTVFCIDSSGSMGPPWNNDPTNLRITESQNFVANHFEVPDRAAVVDFDDDAWLIPSGWPFGDHLSSDYATIINNFNFIDSDGGTVISAGLNLSIMELETYADPNHVPIIILLTDAQSSYQWDIDQCYVEANYAANESIIIITIGLAMITGSLEEQLLIDIASITGGMYFDAPDASHFAAIYENISQLLNDLAVWVMPGDPNPMVRDVLPPGVDLVGNFTIPPDNVYVDHVTNETVIEWDIASIKLGESLNVSFDVKSNIPGRVYTNVYNKSRAYYTRWDNTTIMEFFPKCWVYVVPPAPFPPKLYIDILPNKDDINLFWDEPLSPGTDHYLIYKATNPTGFDFSTPWVNTSSDIDLLDPSSTQWPDRRTWNHTGAADPLDLVEYAEQWYYCIRSVNPVGDRSYTSRTVGKWTREFTLGGVSTFSLPLEPLAIMNTSADYYLIDMNADYIKWMDPGLHVWNKHGDGGVNDTQLDVGKGYEVKFGSPAKFTFMGMPGAMTRYNSGSYLGFDYNAEARDLDASVNPATGDITLTWSAPSNPGTVQYHVYYSTTRDGFHGTRGVDYTLLAALPVGTLTTIHFGAALPDTQYYYMVIPLNATDAEGATTYSIGVWTSGYLAQYDTLGIPLILDSYQTADWYCDIGNVVGINYFIDSSQRWLWHSTRMPQGAFDPTLMMTEGYQISTTPAGTKYSFVGI